MRYRIVLLFALVLAATVAPSSATSPSGSGRRPGAVALFKGNPPCGRGTKHMLF